MRSKTDFKLDESVISLQDLKSLTLEVQTYARAYAHDAIKKQLKARSKKSASAAELSPPAQAVLAAWKTSHGESGKSLEELITTLENYAASAPQFTIILAAPPTQGLKKTIVGWCRHNVSSNMLVNFQFNSTILGGMVVRSGSHVYDWSFRRQILENASKFPEKLRNA